MIEGIPYVNIGAAKINNERNSGEGDSDPGAKFRNE